MEFDDPLASVRAPTQKESKIAERVAVYNDFNMDKVARINESEEKHRKWKAYHRSVRKYRVSVSKEAPSKDNNPS